MCYLGGESAALSRVNEYFWSKDLIRIYKETRNGMLGPDYSTKFSLWLASGCLSPRLVFEEDLRLSLSAVAVKFLNIEDLQGHRNGWCYANMQPQERAFVKALLSPESEHAVVQHEGCDWLFALIGGTGTNYKHSLCNLGGIRRLCSENLLGVSRHKLKLHVNELLLSSSRTGGQLHSPLASKHVFLAFFRHHKKNTVIVIMADALLIWW
ncbi:hypothetical protein IFM89_033884 [Coptis chinensis]|uniref:Uncharacterized protein n=1 Tax=Coptis chinensis TaxID=261450 RepID=A0A835H2G8_9MAGN|nr:hypothetical protein IFM89_033884 [Coptis chinensis]